MYLRTHGPDAEAYISDGHHVTIARTTYAPIEEDAE